ncbi:WD repeat-containing protein 38 isoform X3 [Equus przewalskii]|uniref:WD repeat-containing protein 38 isoform X3 n=1 Tax=Equus przewalskii TaxID=9798 RepID=A0ABM2F590_EQUPR
MNSRAPGTLAVGRVKFFSRHRGEVNSSAFSPDGQTLLTASEDGCVYGWETQSGRLLWRLGGHTGPVKFCRFSPDGRLFASTSCDCTIRLWDVAEAKCLQVLKGHQRSVETVSFSPDSKQLASGGWDKRVMLWEVQSDHVLRHLAGHRDSVHSSEFAPSSDCLATGSWDATIRIWDLRTGTPEVYQELEGHSGNISCLCYSASGLLASGSWDKTIHIWKPSTRSLLLQLKGHVTWVKSITFSPDGLQLASAGYSRMVKVWDCNTGKCMETLKAVLLAGSPGRGPCLHLHPRWEALSVWSCRSGKTPSPPQSNHAGSLEDDTTSDGSWTSCPASPCPRRKGPGGMNLGKDSQAALHHRPKVTTTGHPMIPVVRTVPAPDQGG